MGMDPSLRSGDIYDDVSAAASRHQLPTTNYQLLAAPRAASEKHRFAQRGFRLHQAHRRRQSRRRLPEFRFEQGVMRFDVATPTKHLLRAGIAELEGERAPRFVR